MSDSLQPHGLQHARFPCPSPSPAVCSDSHPLSRWCYLTISSSAALFSFCLQSFPASGSFPMSQLFASGSQRIGASASASVLHMNIQGWFPLGLTGLMSLQVKETLKSFLQHRNSNASFLWCSAFFLSFFFSSLLSEKQWQPTPVLLPGKSHGRRSLVGCRPWGR